MDHFSGFPDYIRFTFAKDFTWKEASATPFKYTKNKYEKIGNLFTKPILKPIDFSLRNGRNPLFIIAMTIGALFSATLLFYPWVVAGVFTPAIAAGIKATAFTLTQSSIVGLCLRTLGRLNNQELMQEWDQHRIAPRGIGSLRI